MVTLTSAEHRVHQIGSSPPGDIAPTFFCSGPFGGRRTLSGVSHLNKFRSTGGPSRGWIASSGAMVPSRDSLQHTLVDLSLTKLSSIKHMLELNPDVMHFETGQPPSMIPGKHLLETQQHPYRIHLFSCSCERKRCISDFSTTPLHGSTPNLRPRPA